MKWISAVVPLVEIKTNKKHSTCHVAYVLTFMLLLMFSVPSSARYQSLPCDLTEQFNQPSCTFVLLNGKTNKLIVSNKMRAKQRMSPFSTFKIAHSLIALEHKLVNQTNDKLTYNREQYPIQDWWPKTWHQNEHTLANAFQHSVVPIYQTLADILGEKTMSNSLKKLNYGNRDITSGVTNFWLNQSLSISAVEQVNFIKKLQQKKFPYNESSYQTLADMMLVKATADYRLYGKTGGGKTGHNKALGWYVGYIIKGDTPYYFAVNTDGDNFIDVKQRRFNITLASLIQTKVLPSTATLQ